MPLNRKRRKQPVDIEFHKEVIRSDYDFETTLERLRVKHGEYYGVQVDVQLRQVGEARASFSFEVKGGSQLSQRVSGVIEADQNGDVILNILRVRYFPWPVTIGVYGIFLVIIVGFFIYIFGGVYLEAIILGLLCWVVTSGIVFLGVVGDSWLKKRKDQSTLRLIQDAVQIPVKDAQKKKAPVRDAAFDGKSRGGYLVIPSHYDFESTAERIRLKGGKHAQTDVMVTFADMPEPDVRSFTVYVTVKDSGGVKLRGRVAQLASGAVQVEVEPNRNFVFIGLALLFIVGGAVVGWLLEFTIAMFFFLVFVVLIDCVGFFVHRNIYGKTVDLIRDAVGYKPEKAKTS